MPKLNQEADESRRNSPANQQSVLSIKQELLEMGTHANLPQELIPVSTFLSLLISKRVDGSAGKNMLTSICVQLKYLSTSITSWNVMISVNQNRDADRIHPHSTWFAKPRQMKLLLKPLICCAVCKHFFFWYCYFPASTSISLAITSHNSITMVMIIKWPR